MARLTGPAIAPRRTTVSRCVSALRLAFVILATISQAARAQATCIPDVWQARVVVVEKRSLGMIIHFENPVDHGKSLLVIVSDGEVIRVLQPRLETEPNTLFARTAMLAPGRYVLQWRARSSGRGDVERGDMPFTIKSADVPAGIVVLAACG
jgi:methionine-rich copper-binding protein CopC